MATVQNLKRKLQVIQSTKKVTQALKSASTAKYSRLNSLYGEYEKYEEQCRKLYSLLAEASASKTGSDASAVACYIVAGSNKGMCGGFNSELLAFAKESLCSRSDSDLLFLCGKKAEDYFTSRSIAFDEVYIFEDIPCYAEVKPLIDRITELVEQGRVSSVNIIYPRYCNMLHQQPVMENVLERDDTRGNDDRDVLFIPDKQTVIDATKKTVLSAAIYKRLLETALGAQAATLTAMRSAYDTACEYSTQLQAEINRKRQGQVTADVIEISAEYSMNTEE